MSMTRTSNGADPAIATLMAEVGSDHGNLALIQVRKKGVVRRGKVYGDATVQVLIWTGFDYKALVERSKNKLDQLLLQGSLISDLTLNSPHPDTNVADTCAAIQDTQTWFRKVLTPVPKQGQPTDSELAWEPLVVNGQRVRGCRVHRDTGVIYVQGVKLGERIVTPAENGDWVPNSKAKTVVKNLLHERLPIGLYVQYSLAKDLVSEIYLGAEASKQAKLLGIEIDPEAVRSLFKIAA